VKKLTIVISLFIYSLTALAQDSTSGQSKKDAKREVKRQRNNAIIKQEEEGVLVFNRQTVGGIELRTNGYGAFLEFGRMKTPRWTNIYSLEITEIKHPKEEKVTSVDGFSNSFVYGKQNNFYQAKLGYGRQLILGQKGNRNGIAVIGMAEGGFSLGMLKPYYLQIQRPNSNALEDVKYSQQDSALFLNTRAIAGGSGFTKGWGELSFKPGLFLKTALRFDFGRFNDNIQAIEIGFSVEAYTEKIPIMLIAENKQVFFQGHVAFVFGRRK
jgi:hypothetical protein